MIEGIRDIEMGRVRGGIDRGGAAPYKSEFAALNQIGRVVRKVQLPQKPARNAESSTGLLRKHEDAVVACVGDEEIGAGKDSSNRARHRGGVGPRQSAIRLSAGEVGLADHYFSGRREGGILVGPLVERIVAQDPRVARIHYVRVAIDEEHALGWVRSAAGIEETQGAFTNHRRR